MEKKFTQEQSVELIKEMIQQAKGNAIEGMQTGVMMLWGYSIFIACVLNFTAWQLELYSYINYIWSSTIMISLLLMFIISRREKKVKIVTTYVDKIVDNVWLGYGVGTILIVFLLPWNMYFPAITFIYAFAIYVMSVAYKSKALTISVFIIIGCIISYNIIPLAYYPVPMAISMLCGNIIPSHMLNSYHKKNVKRA